MVMKRKPHHDRLDPNNPGIPVSRDDLRQASATYQRDVARAAAAEGVTPGALAGKAPVGQVPSDPTGVGAAPIQPHAQPPQPPQPPAPPTGGAGNGQPPGPGPDAAIPTNFTPGALADAGLEDQHPLLDELELNFGIKKLHVEHIMLANYKWTFRPMKFEDYEWMSNNLRRNPVTGDASEPSMSASNVAATLAAINDVPVIDIWKLDTTGRHIPDRLNPPPDLKFEGAAYLLEWFRSKVGMWELISALDEQTDVLFEKQRSGAFPLWGELASPWRRRLVELQEVMSEISSMEDGTPGDEPSPTQESSPQTPEPSSSGTTQEPPTSSSTGATESPKTASTG